MRAYDEMYLDDAMNNLGDMFDYAINFLDYEPAAFYSQFIISGVAAKFERGNPKYIAGLSGPELAGNVIYKTEGIWLDVEIWKTAARSPEYWFGWMIAYYQWYTAYSFSYIKKRGATIKRLLVYYMALHEADISKVVEVIDKIIIKSRTEDISSLKKIRMRKGITQKKLAEDSGVSLRMIQLYEQKQQDIRKAEAGTVVNIAKVLGCDVEELFN